LWVNITVFRTVRYMQLHY